MLLSAQHLQHRCGTVLGDSADVVQMLFSLGLSLGRSARSGQPIDLGGMSGEAWGRALVCGGDSGVARVPSHEEACFAASDSTPRLYKPLHRDKMLRKDSRASARLGLLFEALEVPAERITIK